MLCRHFEGNIPRGGPAGSSVCSVLADIVKPLSEAVLVYPPSCPQRRGALCMSMDIYQRIQSSACPSAS